MTALQTIGERDAALAPADLIDRTRAYAAMSRAQSTRRGYRSDWARFEAWCASKGASALPAEPATVALFLTDRADAELEGDAMPFTCPDRASGDHVPRIAPAGRAMAEKGGRMD